ncbi:MAG: hypothetical protein IH904_06085 [Proteobacteria bacterium]|nr:hypothetical protein [Pseudomonadota bacterium]
MTLPDALPGLTRLKSKYALSTLSNADSAGMVAMPKRAGLPWDCVITADVVADPQARPEGPSQRGSGSWAAIQPR